MPFAILTSMLISHLCFRLQRKALISILAMYMTTSRSRLSRSMEPTTCGVGWVSCWGFGRKKGWVGSFKMRKEVSKKDILREAQIACRMVSPPFPRNLGK